MTAVRRCRQSRCPRGDTTRRPECRIARSGSTAVRNGEPGAIAAAQLTGLPIIPVSYRLGWKKTFQTWDRFQIPLPFSRVEIHFGGAVWVPKDANETQRERLRQEVEVTLRSLTDDS